MNSMQTKLQSTRKLSDSYLVTIWFLGPEIMMETLLHTGHRLEKISNLDLRRKNT